MVLFNLKSFGPGLIKLLSRLYQTNIELIFFSKTILAIVNGEIYVVTVTSKGLNPIRLWAQDWSIAMLAEMDAKWATLPINCWIIEKSCPLLQKRTTLHPYFLVQTKIMTWLFFAPEKHLTFWVTLLSSLFVWICQLLLHLLLLANAHITMEWSAILVCYTS